MSQNNLPTSSQPPSHEETGSSESGLAQDLWNRYGGSPGAYSASPVVQLVGRLAADRLPLLTGLQRRYAPGNFSGMPDLVDIVYGQLPVPGSAARQAVQRQPAVPGEHALQRIAMTPFGAAGIEVGSTLLRRHPVPTPPLDTFSSPRRSNDAPRNELPLTDTPLAGAIPATAVTNVGQQESIAKPDVKNQNATVQRVASVPPEKPVLPPLASLTAETENVSLQPPIRRRSPDSPENRQAPGAVLPPTAVMRMPAVTPLESLVSPRASFAAGAGSLTIEPAIQRYPKDIPDSPTRQPQGEPAAKGIAPPLNSEPLAASQAQVGPPILRVNLAPLTHAAEPAPFIFSQPMSSPGQPAVQRQAEALLPSESPSQERSVFWTTGPVVQPKENPPSLYDNRESIPMPLAGQFNSVPVLQPRPSGIPPLDMPLASPVMMGHSPVLQASPAESPESTPGSAGGAASNVATSNTETTHAGAGTDVELLVNKVWQQLMRRLAIESERKGGRQWP